MVVITRVKRMNCIHYVEDFLRRAPLWSGLVGFDLIYIVWKLFRKFQLDLLTGLRDHKPSLIPDPVRYVFTLDAGTSVAVEPSVLAYNSIAFGGNFAVFTYFAMHKSNVRSTTYYLHLISAFTDRKFMDICQI
tara:strand:- start:1198 stop:1596 length:399 start_codon:yes stop_codon:yes gene_type:complete